MSYEKNAITLTNRNSIRDMWNDRIMERFIKTNLFIICCIAAGLLLIVYLGAFSCEVSWILEAHGELPISAYILCTQFFIVFVATTILIHGLVTGLPWGLFAWSIIIGILSIPELVFVMIMTTQHWGLQSVHGLTELISYLIRLIINCFSLICVIPTGLKWRREAQVLLQLQDLATRLQLQTPPPSAPITQSESSRRSSKRLHTSIGCENIGFHESDASKNQMVHGSQNEFNASTFIPFSSDVMDNRRNPIQSQSLMDLRCTLPGMYNPRYVLDIEDKNGKYFNITIDHLKQNLRDSKKNQTPSVISGNDPIYCSIEPQPDKCDKIPAVEKLPVKLSRNCISLDNLNDITKIQNELTSFEAQYLNNYRQQQQYYLAMLSGSLRPPSPSPFNAKRRSSVSSRGANMMSCTQRHTSPPLVPASLQRCNSQQLMQYYGGFGYANYTNPYITANSKLSLGNESDDYRKYRDVAL